MALKLAPAPALEASASLHCRHRTIKRTVEVDLAAVRVNDLARLLDAALKDAKSRRVRHHERGKVVLVLLRLGLEVLNVEVPRREVLDRDNAHASHDGRRRVGAVRRGGHEAHVAVAVAARKVVRADDRQAGVLALGARVGLQRAAGEAGEPRQVVRKLLRACRTSQITVLSKRRAKEGRTSVNSL